MEARLDPGLPTYSCTPHHHVAEFAVLAAVCTCASECACVHMCICECAVVVAVVVLLSDRCRTRGGLPDAAAIVCIGGKTSTSLQVVWQAPRYDGGEPITGYRLQRVEAADAPGVTDASAVSIVLPFEPCVTKIGKLRGGTRYWFRVAAVNCIGTGADGDWIPNETLPATVRKEGGDGVCVCLCTCVSSFFAVRSTLRNYLKSVRMSL